MTAPDPGPDQVTQAWQHYQQTENENRARYLRTVQEASRQCEAEVQLARDTYDTAERTAWSLYYQAGHQARLDYHHAVSNGEVTQPPPPAATYPYPGDGFSATASGGPALPPHLADHQGSRL